MIGFHAKKSLPLAHINCKINFIVKRFGKQVCWKLRGNTNTHQQIEGEGGREGEREGEMLKQTEANLVTEG